MGQTLNLTLIMRNAWRATKKRDAVTSRFGMVFVMKLMRVTVVTGAGVFQVVAVWAITHVEDEF